MKITILTLLFCVGISVADTTAVTSTDSVQGTAAAVATSVIDHAINKNVSFAGVTLGQTYTQEALTTWGSVGIPLPAKKLFMSKEIEITNATEIYGRILLKCGTLYPFKKLQTVSIDSVKGKCFEVSGKLFQQFENKAGIYHSDDFYFYLSTNSAPPEAVSGWVYADSVFSYRTAMGEKKSLIHLKEHLLFIERSLF
ncbi:MAG: hypothetical protein OCD01_13005 [Fibrobacterales bacterium]